MMILVLCSLDQSISVSSSIEWRHWVIAMATTKLSTAAPIFPLSLLPIRWQWLPSFFISGPILMTHQFWTKWDEFWLWKYAVTSCSPHWLKTSVWIQSVVTDECWTPAPLPEGCTGRREGFPKVGISEFRTVIRPVQSGRLWVRPEVSPNGAFRRSIFSFRSQSFIASMLGVPENRIVVRVKRTGGGFGGKETRSTVVSTAVAMAAYKWVLLAGSRKENKAASARKPFWISLFGRSIPLAFHFYSLQFLELLGIGARVMLLSFSVLMRVSISYLYYLTVRALRARPHLTSYSPTLSSPVPRQQSSPAQVCSVCQVGEKKFPGRFHPWDSWGWTSFSPSDTSLRTGRPVRCMLDRDEDMLITGGRHPFLARYKVPYVGGCARVGVPSH